ncbi:MAG: hypothetical protein RIF41_27295 [Polyangiaceae bacterium]
MPIALGDDVSVEAGGSADLTAGFITMDFGVSANRMLFFGNDGGFALGFDAGFLTSVVGGQWEAEDGGVATVLERARLRGFYMRLTLGGGGFWFDD